MAKFRDDPIKNDKVVTGSTLAYFKTKQDAFNAGKFVAKETGKGLSTNDYTTADKNKLAAVEAGAEVNVIEIIKLNNVDLTPDSDKRVDLGTIATSEALEALTERVDAIEETDLPSKNVTLEQASGGTGDILKTYTIKQGGDIVGSIDIPKDYLVKSAELKTCTEKDKPVTGLDVGDPYLDFVINTKDGSGTDQHLYVPCKSFVDTYTAGNGLSLNNHQFSIDTSITATKASVDDVVSDLADEVTRAKAAEGTNASNISALTTRVGTAESEIDTLQSDMTTAKSNITALQGKVGDTPVEDQIEAAINAEVTVRDSAIATAKSEAISTAASDATTKANAAQSAAEATAAADATSKASTAKSEAIASANAYTDTEVAKKQDPIVAGANITIADDGKTISAKDTTYTAGTNVTISASNVINVADMRYTHPAGGAPSKTLGLYKIRTDSTSHIAEATAAVYSDLPISAENLRNTLEVVTTTEIDSWF